MGGWRCCVPRAGPWVGCKGVPATPRPLDGLEFGSCPETGADPGGETVFLLFVDLLDFTFDMPAVFFWLWLMVWMLFSLELLVLTPVAFGHVLEGAGADPEPRAPALFLFSLLGWLLVSLYLMSVHWNLMGAWTLFFFSWGVVVLKWFCFP